MVDTLLCFDVLWLCGYEHTNTQQQQHSAALEQQDPSRAALVRLLLLLLYCCVSLEHHSSSRNAHGTTTTRLLKHNENERKTRARLGQAVTGTRAPSSSGSSSSSTHRHSSNTRLGQHSYACCTAATCSSMTSTIKNVAANAIRETKIKQINDESHRDTKKTTRYARRRYSVYSSLAANQS